MTESVELEVGRGGTFGAIHAALLAIAGLAILHFFWMRAGKNNFAEVFVYAAILGTLLGWRSVRFMSKKRHHPA